MPSKTELSYALEALANLKSDNAMAEILRVAIAGTLAIPTAQYAMKLSPTIMEQHLRQIFLCTDMMTEIRNKVKNELLCKEVKE